VSEVLRVNLKLPLNPHNPAIAARVLLSQITGKEAEVAIETPVSTQSEPLIENWSLRVLIPPGVEDRWAKFILPDSKKGADSVAAAIATVTIRG